MGFLDPLLGRRKTKASAPDRLFAITTAYVSLEAEHGIATAGAAVITGRPSALSSALLKISGAMERTPTQDLRAAGELNAFFIVPASLKNSIFNLFATHPPLEKRIEALSRLEAQLQSGARPVAA